MKVKCVVIAALCLTLLGAGICLAADDVMIYINGQAAADAKGLIIDGKTMVPVRFVSETLGAKVQWDGNLKRVYITTVPKTNLIKLNGEATTWPYWYEDGILYMEYRNVLQLVREYYPHPSYVPAFFKSTNTFMLSSKTIDMDAKKKGDYIVLPLNALKKEGIINYDWDAKNSNLIMKEPGK